LFFPLTNKEETFGVLQLSFELVDDEQKMQKNFIQILHLITSQVSRAIKTLEYIERMETSVKFYQTMKDVAKIIETQYELNYILPILGEMIDKFISQHLIYIFLKNPRKGDYTLVWPANCTDKNIQQTLERTSSATSTVIEDKGKMGIFPIVCDEKSIGAIVAYNRFDVLTNSEIEYLEQLSSQASLTVDKATSYSKILQHATLDALTGLNNRHQFAHRLKQETATAKRQNAPLCCIMLDVDFFKKVNDNYGHAVGDCVLKNVAKIIKKEIREYDIASRYGGEEFSILTPHTTIDEAYLIAQRLRSEIEKKKINIEEYRIEGKKEISVTISVGVSLFDKKKSDPAILYQDADKALYEAKEHGRNRVVVFGGNEC
jgi:diguanylate cyclase (GGDEF)-like protein